MSRQVVPPVLAQYLKDPNPAKANNVMQAMRKMRKIILADLQAAYDM